MEGQEAQLTLAAAWQSRPRPPHQLADGPARRACVRARAPAPRRAMMMMMMMMRGRRPPPRRARRRRRRRISHRTRAIGGMIDDAACRIAGSQDRGEGLRMLRSMDAMRARYRVYIGTYIGTCILIQYILVCTRRRHRGAEELTQQSEQIARHTAGWFCWRAGRCSLPAWALWAR